MPEAFFRHEKFSVQPSPPSAHSLLQCSVKVKCNEAPATRLHARCGGTACAATSCAKSRPEDVKRGQRRAGPRGKHAQARGGAGHHHQARRHHVRAAHRAPHALRNGAPPRARPARAQHRHPPQNRDYHRQHGQARRGARALGGVHAGAAAGGGQAVPRDLRPRGARGGGGHARAAREGRRQRGRRGGAAAARGAPRHTRGAHLASPACRPPSPQLLPLPFVPLRGCLGASLFGAARAGWPSSAQTPAARCRRWRRT